jgi:hypothetical protein
VNAKLIAQAKAVSIMTAFSIFPDTITSSKEVVSVSEEQFGRFNFNYVFEARSGMMLHVLVNTQRPDFVWWQLLAR